MSEFKIPSMPTIAYVVKRFPKLSETFVLNEILRLEQLGLNITVFSLEAPEGGIRHSQYSHLKARVTYLPRAWRLRSHRCAHSEAMASLGPYSKVLQKEVLKTGRPKLLWRFTQALHLALALRNSSVSHMHAHFASRATTVTYLASRLTGVPFSFTAHAYDLYQCTVARKLLRSKLLAAKFVITISDFNREFLESCIGNKPARIWVIRNGIELELFVPGKHQPSAGNPFKILSVARLTEKKGLRYLVDACRILRSQGIEFRCQIAGGGKLERKLVRQIHRCDLSGHVQLLGPLPQERIVELYQNADLFVLSSIVASDGNREGLPVAIVEALACGLPVVSSRSTGIPEVVLDDHNGLLVPERDAQALSDAICELIRNRDRYRCLAKNARPSVVGDYEIGATSRELFQLFTDGLGPQ